MVKATTLAAAAPCIVAAADAFVATPAQTRNSLRAPAVGVEHAAAAQQDVSTASSSIAFGAAGVAAVGAALSRSAKKGKAVQKPVVSLTAFENELGVQAPIGFWDPLGYTADGDAVNFARRRQTEIKHGRVSMLAVMGYMTPEITGKFPGYLSPSAGLKFADIPNGLAAISKVPGAGWAQIAAWMAMCEVTKDQSPGSAGATGDLGWKVITSSDTEGLNRKLNAEIANGRLAMMAIMGMFFQDGLTGAAWGDWGLYSESPLRFGGSDVSAPAKPKFDPETELGVQDPIGFWDPLDFCAEKDEADFKRRRTVEIKHGRISMYATIGYIVPEYFRFPGDLSPSAGLKFADMPNGLAALSKLPALGGAQMVAFAGIIETTGFFSGSSTSGRGPRALGQMKDSTEEAEPGNYGIGFPNFIGTVSDPEERKTKLAAELANGRLAMMAIIGMFFQDGLTGSAWGDWATYSGSPLRAFESELGVQAPVGFWDPVGFTADGDEAAFKRRRSVEIKHGRICMMATMGYITPEVVGKLPGFLSPSAGLKFSDVPNGLAAISKVPTAGWAQIAAYFGFVEFSGGFDDYKGGTPGDYGFKVLTSDDPEEKSKKLSAEIANGRLAMMAIIGMFFQDGLTGSAWGSWASYTDSPLRAFETELGVQAPTGFWDPLNLLDGVDEMEFKRIRSAEIKHGRIAMLAATGFLAPFYSKLPGYLSPSLNIKFADIPQGTEAINKVPVGGWIQILLFGALCEFGQPKGIQEWKTGEPGDYGRGFLGMFGKITDPEKRKRSLNAEIANGRLAMAAITGMVIQEGITGTTGPAMWYGEGGISV